MSETVVPAAAMPAAIARGRPGRGRGRRGRQPKAASRSRPRSRRPLPRLLSAAGQSAAASAGRCRAGGPDASAPSLTRSTGPIPPRLTARTKKKTPRHDPAGPRGARRREQVGGVHLWEGDLTTIPRAAAPSGSPLVPALPSAAASKRAAWPQEAAPVAPLRGLWRSLRRPRSALGRRRRRQRRHKRRPRRSLGSGIVRSPSRRWTPPTCSGPRARVGRRDRDAARRRLLLRPRGRPRLDRPRRARPPRRPRVGPPLGAAC